MRTHCNRYRNFVIHCSQLQGLMDWIKVIGKSSLHYAILRDNLNVLSMLHHRVELATVVAQTKSVNLGQVILEPIRV